MPENWPVYVPDQITSAVSQARNRLATDWTNCLRCLRLAVGGEASDLSGCGGFAKPQAPVPANFDGWEYEFVMPFDSGATLKLRLRKDAVMPVEWRPVAVREGGQPYRVQTTTVGEVECRDGLAAVWVASKNGT